MRILITGITGMVGSHMADFFLGGDLWKPAQLYAVNQDRLAVTKPQHCDRVQIYGIRRWRSDMSNLRQYGGRSEEDRIEFIDADITDAIAVRNAIEWVRPDFIFHLAAQSFVPFSYENPALTLQVNAVGTANILESMRGLYSSFPVEKRPVVHVCSSCEVYGHVPEDECPITESNELQATSPYALSKIAADRLASMYWEAHGVRTVISRAFSHTGARRNPLFVESSIAKQIVEIEKGHREPEIHIGNPDSIRTFMHVKDVVAAYWLLANYGEFGHAYNVASRLSSPITIQDLIGVLLAQSSLDPATVAVETGDPDLLRPKDAARHIPDCRDSSKFGRLLSACPIAVFPFWPNHTDEIYKDLIEYWRENL